MCVNIIVMKENVIIATALNNHVRIYLANTKELVEKARLIHNMWPTSLAALGRVMSITGIMALKQKEEDEVVTTTINGGGPIGTIMAVGQSNGDVKGFVGDNEIYLKYNDSNKLAVGKAVGVDGYLKVTKNLKLKNQYTSQVKLQSGEIGDDFSYYFSVSEQVPTICSVGVLVDVDYSTKAAGALLIELLPDYDENDIAYLEELLKELRPISSVLEKDDDLDKYLLSLFADGKVLERKTLRYHCDCSRERFLKGLLTLPKKDLLEVLDEDEIKIKCEFCDKEYIFNKDDIKLLSKYV